MPAASIRMTLTVILAGMVVMAMTPEQEKQAADLARAAHDATRANVVTDAVPDAGEECSISEEARGECSNGKFVPSAAWQEVFEGQVVPEECDMRIDLETGKEFARLKPKTAEPVFTEAEESAPAVDQEEREAAATAKMYEILLSLPEVPPELVDDGASKLSPAELKELISKLWNRRQAYLREVYEDVETEQELLQGDLQMLKMLKSPADDTRIVALLEELEYLVAQTDNARTIANLDGWGSIVALLTAEIGAEGQTDDVIRMAAWTIATAVKLDPDVQGAALDAAAMPALIKLLNSRENSRPASTAAKTKVFFAIGNFLRGNRRAQRIFHSSGGFGTMRAALRRPDENAAEHEKMVSKIFTLVQDLVSDSTTLPSVQSMLQTPEWCEAVAEGAMVIKQTHTRELALHAMVELRRASSGACDSVFDGAERRKVWDAWAAEWGAQGDEHGDELKDLVLDFLERK